jgi:hypothetical protein
MLYQGRWAQMPINGRFPTQDPTRYLKTDRETDLEIRETLQMWCEYVACYMQAEADAIRAEQTQLTAAQARKIAWATIDHALKSQADSQEPIELDPQVYSTEYIVKFCLRELQAVQNSGLPKDVKRSMVNRHNWQVVHWAYSRFGITCAADITPACWEWMDQRLIDVQAELPAVQTRASRLLDSVFDSQ